MICVNKINNKLIIDVCGVLDYNYNQSENVACDIMNFQKDKEISEIDVRIDTCGGNLVFAFSVANAIKTFTGVSKNAIVLGNCMSAGIPILLSCENRKAGENAFFMIHAVSTFAFGNKETLNKTVENLNLYDEMVLEDVKKVVKDEKTLSEYWENETIFNSKTALKLGLVTDIAINETNINMSAYSPFTKLFNKNEEMTAFIDCLRSENAALKEKAGVSDKMELKDLGITIKNLQDRMSANEKDLSSLTVQLRNFDNPTLPTFSSSDNKTDGRTTKSELKRILRI